MSKASESSEPEKRRTKGRGQNRHELQVTCNVESISNLMPAELDVVGPHVIRVVTRWLERVNAEGQRGS